MSPDSSPAAELRRSLAIAAEKVEAIIAEAESAAAQIHADAQTVADEHRERSMREVDSEIKARSQQLDSIIAPLMHRVETLHTQAQQLADELQATSAKMREASAPIIATPDRVALDSPQASPAEEPGDVVEEEIKELPEPGNLDRALDPGPPDLEPPASPAGSEPSPVDMPLPADEPAGESGPLVEPDPRRQFTASGGPPGPAPVAYPGVAPGADEGLTTDPEPEVDYSSEDALLRATQLAVSGSSRPEIAEALQAEFKIDDVEAVLDGILGPEPG